MIIWWNKFYVIITFYLIFVMLGTLLIECPLIYEYITSCDLHEIKIKIYCDIF